jgi:hypothetical protein
MKAILISTVLHKVWEYLKVHVVLNMLGNIIKVLVMELVSTIILSTAATAGNTLTLFDIKMVTERPNTMMENSNVHILRTDHKMATESENKLMELCIMENSEITILMAMGTLSMLTTMSTTDNGDEAANMEKEFSKRRQLVKFKEGFT